jgi:hypothetical protein
MDGMLPILLEIPDGFILIGVCEFAEALREGALAASGQTVNQYQPPHGLHSFFFMYAK